MTGEKIAVIDLGSNTFHLLICEVTADKQWIEIHKEREYVKLASGGLDFIDEDSIQRAIDAMVRFMQLIKKYEVTQTRAIGTAALREAINGQQIANLLTEVTSIPIEIIDGHREASLIHLGIKSVLPALDAPGLIMDIGGGSVEFILYDSHTVLYAQSFKIGVAVLYRLFHKSNPISNREIESLEGFLEEQLTPLIHFVSDFPEFNLVGASGSFEVIYAVLPRLDDKSHWAELDMTDLILYMDKVIHSTYDERARMPEVPEERLDYIVVAYLLIRFLIRRTGAKKLYYCEYAMKEGVVTELIHNI